MKKKKVKGCLNERSTLIGKIIPILIISVALFGCFDDSLGPIFDKSWFCTVNTDGTDLNYIREASGYIMPTPDRTKLIEFSKNKFYAVNINDLADRVLIYDLGDSSYFTYPVIYNDQILYSDRGDIYSFSLENYNIARLTHSPPLEECKSPALSEDGSKIAYSTTIYDSLSSITIMNSDGTNPYTIIEYTTSDTAYTYSSYISIGSINFVMDDQVILYKLFKTSNLEFPEGIYSINVDGSNNTCLVEGLYIRYLTLSPNRDYVIFNDSGNIYKMNTNGTNCISLCDSADYDVNLSISPNSEKILFGYDGYPFIMNTNGSNKYKLVDSPVEKLLFNQYDSYFLNNNKVFLRLEIQIN